MYVHADIKLCVRIHCAIYYYIRLRDVANDVLPIDCLTTSPSLQIEKPIRKTRVLPPRARRPTIKYAAYISLYLSVSLAPTFYIISIYTHPCYTSARSISHFCWKGKANYDNCPSRTIGIGFRIRRRLSAGPGGYGLEEGKGIHIYIYIVVHTSYSIYDTKYFTNY